MAEIARLPTERARFEPETVFQHPAEIVGEFLLTRGQKLAALGRWREHILQQSRAAGEGMAGPDEWEAAADSELLAEIERAETALAEPPPSD